MQCKRSFRSIFPTLCSLKMPQLCSIQVLQRNCSCEENIIVFIAGKFAERRPDNTTQVSTGNALHAVTTQPAYLTSDSIKAGATTLEAAASTFAAT